MARKPRIFLRNTSQHIYLTSLSGLKMFQDSRDYETFLTMVEESHLSNSIKIHAFVFQKNSFEFLLTPKESNSLAKFMQTLARKYVGYYNKKYSHQGTIFNGRYKSSLVEDSYFLQVMKFIEKKESKEYLYSSLKSNLLNKENKILNKHKLFRGLSSYEEFYNSEINKEIFSFIENSLQNQSITGSSAFIKTIEKQTGMHLITNSVGRPKKKELIKRKKMYKHLVVLDKREHATLKVNPLESLHFAKNVSNIPITLKEFLTVSQIFPVVFSLNEEPSLVAIVALGGENLAVTADGKWIDSYIPTHIGKYPFALASTDKNSEEKIIMIDATASVFSRSKGRQLFKKNGENSAVLDKAITTLVEHEKNINEMKKLSKEIADSGILENRNIKVGQGDEEQVLVGWFNIVNKDKLNALDKKILLEWEKRGILKLIDAHLNSLKNIELLFKLAHARQNQG